MEITPTMPLAQAEQQASAPITPDKRPSADSAAVTRDPTPELPLAIPPATRQDGLIGAAMLKAAAPTSDTPADQRVSEAERTLKPYGVTMLPTGPGSDPETGPDGRGQAAGADETDR